MDDPRRARIAEAISSALSTPPEIDAIAEAIGAAVASACREGAGDDCDAVEDRARRAALGVLKMHLRAADAPRRR